MNRERFSVKRVAVLLGGFLLVAATAVLVYLGGLLGPRWPTHEFRREAKIYPCEPGDGNMVVDGDLTEWEDAVWLPVGTPWQAGLDWKGRPDFEARVAVRWDADALHLAARVRDNRIITESHPQVFGGDGILLQLGRRSRGRQPQRFFLAPRWPRRDQCIIWRGLQDRLGDGDGLADRSPFDPAGDLGLRFDGHGLPHLADVDLDGRRGGAELGEGWGATALLEEGRTARRAYGRRAVLTLPVTGSSAVRLVLTGKPAESPRGAKQRLRAWVNGKAVGDPHAQDWSARKTFSFPLPAEALSRIRGNRVVLAFDHADGEPEQPDGKGHAATFESIRIVTSGDSMRPAVISAGDLNGDGLDDVCGWSNGWAFAYSPRGGWAWRSSDKIPRPRCLAAGDVDGDGDADLVALEDERAVLHVLTPVRDTMGRVVLAEDVASQRDGWRSMIAADVNLDGESELLVLGQRSLNVLALRDGEWRIVQDCAVPETSRWLLSGDFDGDREFEVASVANGNKGSVVRFWEPTASGLDEAGEVSLREQVTFAAAGDTNGDSLHEIVLAVPEADAKTRMVLYSPRSGAVRPLGNREAREPALVGNFIGVGGGYGPRMGRASLPGSVRRRLRGVPPPEDPKEPEISLSPLEKAPCAAVRVPGGYRLEARIPWTEFADPKPEPGDSVPFRLTFQDVDTPSRSKTVRYCDYRKQCEFELLSARLPRKLGPEHGRFLPALTALGLDVDYLIEGEQRFLEVLKGASPGRLPALRIVRAKGRYGGSSRGKLVERKVALGCEAITYLFGPGALADGEAELKAAYEKAYGDAATRVLIDCRAWQYKHALKAGLEAVRRLRAFGPKTPEAVAEFLVEAESRLAWLKSLPDRVHRGNGLLGLRGRLMASVRLAEEAITGRLKNEDRPSSGGHYAYWSDIDGSAQPYALSVPKGYLGDWPWPLVVRLHGAGYDPQRLVKAPERPDAFVLAPHGRGWTDYMYVGEADVMRVIERVCRRFTIDPDRIYLTGGSMGGTGCWHLASRYPDRFAAIAPVCGNSDTSVWDAYWGRAFRRDDPRRDLRQQLRKRLDPVTFARNLHNVHAMAAHGARDKVVYVEASRRVVDELRSGGAVPIYREEPRSGHRVSPLARADLTTWLLAQRRVRAPRRIRLRVAEDRHGKAYWIRVERRRDPLAIAEIDALINDTNEIRVTHTNVEAFSVDLSACARRPDPQVPSTERLPDAWEGLGADRVGKGDVIGFTGDGETEHPVLMCPLDLPETSDPMDLWLSMWIRSTTPLASPVDVGLTYLSLEEPQAFLSRVTVSPSTAWQYVEVTAVSDPDVYEPLVCMIGLGEQPNSNGLEIRDVRVSHGGVPDSALARPVSNPSRWLSSGRRIPAGGFPWCSLNRLYGAGAFLPLGLPEPDAVGMALKSAGTSTTPIAVDGPPGTGYVAGVWARADRTTGIRVALGASGRSEDLASVRATVDREWRLVSLKWARQEGVSSASLKVRPEGGLPVEVTGAFVVRHPVVPEAFRLRPVDDAIDFSRPIRIVANNKIAYEGPVPDSRRIRIGDPAPERTGLCKTEALRGPVEHAFEGPFLLVFGTQGPERERRIAHREGGMFLRDWEYRYSVPCRFKDDTEVTAEDIERYHLILYGGPRINTVAARVMPGLPVRVEGPSVVAGDKRFHGEDVGMKVVYPNPLNPKRYVVVLAATTWRGMFQITKRFGNWFGWRVYEHRNWYDFVVFDDVSRDPATFLLVGFFDDSWRLSPDRTYRADAAWRAAIPRRGLPSLDKPAAERQVTYLSEVEPFDVDMRMGTYGINRSYLGNPLRPGGMKCGRGLGVRVGSVITYRLSGDRERFQALVGVDNEGDVPTPERQRVTRVRFEVWGDDKLLSASATHRWNDPPEEMDVPIRGVRFLELRVVARGGRSWVYGSASWGNACVRGAAQADTSGDGDAADPSLP